MVSVFGGKNHKKKSLVTPIIFALLLKIVISVFKTDSRPNSLAKVSLTIIAPFLSPFISHENFCH